MNEAENQTAEDTPLTQDSKEVVNIEEKVKEPLPPLKTGNAIAAIVPENMSEIWRMSKALIASKMIPKEVDTPEKAVAIIMKGLEVGLKPIQAIESIALINGRATIWGDAAIGLVMDSGLVEDFEESFEGKGDTLVATCKIKRKGIKSYVERRFSKDDAVKAGLWGRNVWAKYPQRMLQMRARSWALRDGFADVLKGLQVREEAQDYSHQGQPKAENKKLTAQSVIDGSKEAEDAEFEEVGDTKTETPVTKA